MKNKDKDLIEAYESYKKILKAISKLDLDMKIQIIYGMLNYYNKVKNENDDKRTLRKFKRMIDKNIKKYNYSYNYIKYKESIDEEELNRYDFILKITDYLFTPWEIKTDKINLEIFDNETKKCSINGENYEINSSVLKKIKEYIDINFNKLVEYSIVETKDYIEKNKIRFYDRKKIYLKKGNVQINLNGGNEGEISEYVNDFEKNIILLIKGE